MQPAAPPSKETRMHDIDLEVQPGTSIEEAVQQAFVLVARIPDARVVLEYGTICSSGKFLITSESSYNEHMAAFDRAQNHTGEFETTYDKGVVIGP